MPNLFDRGFNPLGQSLTSRSRAGRRRWLVAGALLVFAVAAWSGQDAEPEAQDQPVATETADTQDTAEPAAEPASPPTTQVTAATPLERYGLWTLTPAVVAILIAVLTRQVIAALGIGILTGAGMMVFAGAPPSSAAEFARYPVECVKYATENYLIGVLYPLKPERAGDTFKHIQVILFTLLIGAMVGVIEANGGTRAMVARLTRFMRTRESGQIGAWLSGMAVFFDDYASTMIVGPGMRPVFDRLRISRQKLAYIVDSTAAPIASILIGTWLAAEISYLDEGLSGVTQRPDFLAGMTGSTAFWMSIPYRTYALFALVMVFLIAFTGRDFGAMRRAEEEASAGVISAPISRAAPPPGRAAVETPNDSHWLLGFLPVATLVVMTIGLLMSTGIDKCTAKGIALDWSSVGGIGRSIRTALGEADSYYALLYSALTGALVAVVSTVLSMRLSLAKTMEGFADGMARIFAGLIILVLAWGLSQTTKDLHLGRAVADFLDHHTRQGNFDVHFLPLSIFITACLISFATGTSWGTMAILCPVVVAIAAQVLAPLPADQALHLFYWSVGSVLAGAVFGDHCSPISDTTVMSALFSDCDLGAHVWTQMPYAVVVALVSILCPDLLEYTLRTYAPAFYEQNWSVYWSLACGVVLLLLIVLILGRRPRQFGPPVSLAADQPPQRP